MYTNKMSTPQEILGLPPQAVPVAEIKRAYRRKIAPLMIFPGHYPRELQEKNDELLKKYAEAYEAMMRDE